jgi:predicted nucleotidyltransferase
MIALLEENREKIAELCRQFGIRQLDVFGSAATGAFDPEKSDIDFVVDLGGYEPGVSIRFVDFAEALEGLLGYDVDLITEDSIRNPYFRRSVDQSRERVYERTGDQAVA